MFKLNRKEQNMKIRIQKNAIEILSLFLYMVHKTANGLVCFLKINIEIVYLALFDWQHRRLLKLFFF